MGGNIFSNLPRIEYPDFTGDRARYEALKHAELQRKLQTQQALQQQAKFEREKQDWQREDAFRGALGSLPLTDESGAIPGTTLTALAKIDPIRTSTLSEAMAKRAAAVSEARIKAQAEKEHHSKLGFYDFSSAMQMEDPQKRFEHVMSRFDRYEKLGVLEQPELEDLATNGLTPKLIDRVGTRLLGPEEYGKIQAQALAREEAKKKAEAEDLIRPSETAAKITKNEFEQTKAASVDMYNATNKEEYEAAWNGLPERQRARFPKEFTPANRYKALGLGQTAAELAAQAQRAVPDSLEKITIALNDPNTPTEELPRLEQTRKQLIENRIATQRPEAGGVDIPGLIAAVQKDPTVYAGLPGEVKAKITPGLSAAGFTGFGKNPITPAIKGQAQGLKDLENAVNEYRTELDRVGPTFRPGKGAKLNTLYTNLMMKVKGPEMYALGVLAGPDMAVLGNALSPPDSAKANFALGTSGLRDQLSVFDALIASKRGVLKEMYGIGEEGKPAPANTQPAANAQPQAKPAPNPLLKPGSVIVRTPDGAFTFPNQAEADAFKKKAGL